MASGKPLYKWLEIAADIGLAHGRLGKEEMRRANKTGGIAGAALGKAQPRRMGAEDSQMRARFVDAAEAILREDGYPGISARRVAEKAELKTQLLYYYFRTMEDLLLALVRRFNERREARFEAALASPEPLRALWELSSAPSAATVSAELTSIASHREAIRAEMIGSAERFRARQIEAVSRLLPPEDAERKEYPAAGMVMIAAALSRTIVLESALGLTAGHREALQIVERMLSHFSGHEDGRPRLTGKRQEC